MTRIKRVRYLTVFLGIVLFSGVAYADDSK
jgi:hypothetical protein